MSVRTKDQLRLQWANGDTISQPVAYDLIDTLYVGVCAAPNTYNCFSTVSSLSSNWESVYSTVCSLSTEWDPISSWGFMKTTVPVSFSANGSMGNWSYDSNNFYFCVSSNTWIKWVISTLW